MKQQSVTDLRFCRRHELMNGSKPCGPSGHARVPRRRPTPGAMQVALFPSPRPRKEAWSPRGFTPSPVRRGRIVRCFGLGSDRFERSHCGDGQRSFGSANSVGNCSLSQRERVRVREESGVTHRESGDHSATVQLCSPPTEPEVSEQDHERRDGVVECRGVGIFRPILPNSAAPPSHLTSHAHL